MCLYIDLVVKRFQEARKKKREENLKGFQHILLYLSVGTNKVS